MSDISNVERRAIVNNRKTRARKDVNGPELWRARFMYPLDLDDLNLNDSSLFARYAPLAAASDPALHAGMRETYWRGTLESYIGFVSNAEGYPSTPLTAFFARARLWKALDFDADALGFIAELPPAREAYPAVAVEAVRELVESGGFVPPGYAAPLVMAFVDADTIVAAYLDRMPLEFAALLGSE